MLATLRSTLNPFLRARSCGLELIDGPVADAQELAQAYRDMERYNALFGGLRPTVEAATRLRPKTLIGVGCGSGGLSLALSSYADKLGCGISITGVDSSAFVLEMAKKRSTPKSMICYVQEDGRRLSYSDRSFDVATCTLTIHHCDEPAAILLLSELRRVAKHPIVADLRRCTGGLIGAYFIANFMSRNRITRNDAPLSVRRAYTAVELLTMAKTAGWNKPIVRHTAFYRMLLIDEE